MVIYAVQRYIDSGMHLALLSFGRYINHAAITRTTSYVTVHACLFSVSNANVHTLLHKR